MACFESEILSLLIIGAAFMNYSYKFKVSFRSNDERILRIARFGVYFSIFFGSNIDNTNLIDTNFMCIRSCLNVQVQVCAKQHVNQSYKK